MLGRDVPVGSLTGPSTPLRSRHRHRAARARQRQLTADAAWPLAAIALVALLGARVLQHAARPGEGRLAGAGFLLTATRDDPSASPLSPEGLGAQHVAVYAALTRVFDRADTLVVAGRELVLVVTVVSAVLLWRTARRLGAGSRGTAVAVLLAGVPTVLSPLALMDVPAQLAVPWLLLAAWLTVGGRPSPAAMGIAALATALGVLLAPDTVVLLLTAAAAALAVGVPRRPSSWAPASGALAAGAVLLVAVAAGSALLLPQWDPQPVVVGTGTLLASAAAFLVVGGLAAWLLDRLRVPALALVATTLIVLLPSGRLSALTVCLPLAAVLAAVLAVALGQPLVAPIAERSVAALRRAGALALAAAVAVAAVALVRTPQAAVGDRTTTSALLSWVDTALPAGARLAADGSLRAQLIHAGGSPDALVPPAETPPGDAGTPPFRIVRDRPPEGALVLARFDGTGATGPLLVLDPAPVAPTAEELARRRSLAGALLANPTTTTGGRAAEVLRSGEIDARLVSLLAALGAQYGVGIRDLPPAAGAPAGGPPVRRAVLDRLAGAPLRPGAPATERLLAWLDAQLPPFAPDDVTSTDEGVVIDFRYAPNPDALVSDSTG